MKKRKTILILLILLFCGIFIYCGATLVIEFSQRERDDETFDELADLIMLPETFEESSNAQDESLFENDNDVSTDSESSADAMSAVIHKRNLQPVIEKNNDCVGWIYIEDTQVNYPVMYTPNEPQKYIDKSFDLKSSSYGVPFIEGECTPNSDHIIIYGHNMKNGSMFAAIKLYRDKAFFDAHPTIEYETLEGCKTYTVVAICEISSTDKWYSFLDKSNKIDFDAQFSRILKRAVNCSDVALEYDKQILTLSTCQGGDKAARLVLIAIEE